MSPTEKLAVSYRLQNRNSRSVLLYDIPALDPIETKNVEGLPQVRPGQNIPLTNEEWLEWREWIWDHRMRVMRECGGLSQSLASSPAMRKAHERECALVRADERYWFNTYASIYEARSEDNDETILFDDEEAVELIPQRAGLLPFILYPFQDYWITWQRRALQSRGPKGDTITIKSRDMGMSNTGVGMLAYRWMTRSTFQGRVLSRVEELVDATGDPDSLFWKLDTMLRTTPRWMLEYFVPGFNWKVHRRHMTLEHPTSANAIRGESTNASAGRGKRATIILLDEFAFMKRLRAIWRATRPSTYHRMGISSASTQEGLDAYTIAKSGVPAIIIMDSRMGMHPMQDKLWHEQERGREVFVGEYDQEQGMDWFADASDFVYPLMLKKEVGNYPYIPNGGPVWVTQDDGAHWAFWVIQYVRETGRCRVIDAYYNRGRKADFYGALYRGIGTTEYPIGPNEERLIKLFRTIPIEAFVGDTHGAHVEQIAGMSVIDALAINWGIYVNVDYQNREYIDRMEAMNARIPTLDFNDTPGVVEGLTAFQMYSFRPTPPGKEVAREQRVPLHNDDSHYVTAMEFWATLFDALLAAVQHQPAEFDPTGLIGANPWVGQPSR